MATTTTMTITRSQRKTQSVKNRDENMVKLITSSGHQHPGHQPPDNAGSRSRHNNNNNNNNNKTTDSGVVG